MSVFIAVEVGVRLSGHSGAHQADRMGTRAPVRPDPRHRPPRTSQNAAHLEPAGVHTMDGRGRPARHQHISTATALAIRHSGQHAVEQALNDALAPFTQDHGQVTLPGWFRVVQTG